MTPHWWTDVEYDVLSVLRENGAMAPGDLASRIGVSEAAATSLLSMLACEGKVRIRLVECVEERVVVRKPAGPARGRPPAHKPHVA